MSEPSCCQERLPEDKKRLHELELLLMEIERGNPNVSTSDIAIGLQEMVVRLDDLERLAQREPKNRRDDYRRRVQHLRTAHAHIKSSLDSLVRRRDQDTHNTQRQELFAGASHDVNNTNIDLEMAESGSLGKTMQTHVLSPCSGLKIQNTKHLKQINKNKRNRPVRENAKRVYLYWTGNTERSSLTAGATERHTKESFRHCKLLRDFKFDHEVRRKTRGRG